MLRRNGMLKSEAAGWDMLEAVRGSVEQQELEEVVEAEAAAQPHMEQNLEELDLECKQIYVKRKWWIS